MCRAPVCVRIWVTCIHARPSDSRQQGGSRCSGRWSDRTLLFLGQIAPQPAVALADLSHSGWCQVCRDLARVWGRRGVTAFLGVITSHLPTCPPAGSPENFYQVKSFQRFRHRPISGSCSPTAIR